MPRRGSTSARKTTRRPGLDCRLLIIEVNNGSSTVQRVAELGGKVMVPPQKIPDGDEVATLHDPVGIPFGLKRRTPE